MPLLDCRGLVKDYPGKRAVDGVDFIGPAPLVDQGREKTDSEALLEITRIEERVDVEAVLGKIGQRVEAILAEELRYTEVEISQFKNVVAELCHNILDHSENWGYLTAQRYTDPREGRKYVVIGVGDLGIGIKKSLSVRYESAAWSHGQAITNSLRKHFSRDTTRGLGLYIVNQICNRYNGSLHSAIERGDIDPPLAPLPFSGWLKWRAGPGRRALSIRPMAPRPKTPTRSPRRTGASRTAPRAKSVGSQDSYAHPCVRQACGRRGADLG